MADDVSTRFPFISLEKALAKAEQLFAGDRSGKAMPVTTAFELWGYSPKSSGGFQTTGALKGYGLIDDEGANADRKLKLTDAARRYFLDERDEIRASMLADFALNPPLFRALWTTDGWSGGIPADTVARSHLKLERKLNDQSARSFLAIFKENVQFAGLKSNEIRHEAYQPSIDNVTEKKILTEVNKGVTAAHEQTGAAFSPVATPGILDARILGDRVIISANVDLKGIRKLRRQIMMFEQILSMEDDEDTE